LMSLAEAYNIPRLHEVCEREIKKST